MNDIRIRGRIVNASWDMDFLRDVIERGIITPSSVVVAEIESATEPFALYISSIGGDVFAAGDILSALIGAANGGKVSRVVVGSIAASAAANIVAAMRALGVPVVAYPHSELMFHGCYTTTDGGASKHEDTAAALRNINNAVISNLVALGITDCRAWFAEGREKWISAKDALAMGIVTSIVGEDGGVVSASVKSGAMQIAACLSCRDSRYSSGMDEKTNSVDAAIAESVKTPEAEAPATEAPAVEDVVAEAAAENIDALVNARFAALQSKHDKMISEMREKIGALSADLESANAAINQSNERAEALAGELAEVRNHLSAEENAHNRIVAAPLAIGEDSDTREVNHAEVLASLPLAKRAEYYARHRAAFLKN